METVVKINLWGHDVAAIAWNNDKNVAVIEFFDTFNATELNISPLMMPLNDLKQPSFEIISAGFSATVFADNKYDTNNVTKDVVDMVTENVTENVTEKRLVLIINEIKKNPQVSYEQLSNLLGVTKMTISRDIEKLKQLDILKRIGPAKGGHWQIL